MHQGTDYIKAFPWDPFQGAPGDRLHKSLPLGPFNFRVHQGTDYIKAFPGTLFRVHQGTDYIKTKNLPLGPFSGYTRGRLHRTRQVFSWDLHEGTDYTGDILHRTSLPL